MAKQNMTEKDLRELLQNGDVVMVDDGSGIRFDTDTIPDTSEPGELRVVIPNHRAPSINRMYAGMHWTKRRKLVDEIRWIVTSSMPREIDEPFPHPVVVSIFAEYKSQPVDADNVYAKLYIDALKILNVIRDDDPRYVLQVCTSSVRAGQDRVVIVVG